MSTTPLMPRLKAVLPLLLAATLLLSQWTWNPGQLDAASEKVDPALKREMSAEPGKKLPIIIELAQPKNPPSGRSNGRLADEAMDILGRQGQDAQRVGSLPLINGAAGFANARAINALSNNPRVAFVYLDSPIGPRDSSYLAEPAAELGAPYPLVSRADRVWAEGGTGKGITVAVLDSGIAPHPDLTAPTNRILASVNFAGDLGGMQDAGGHGTHVAGVIAGNSTYSDLSKRQVSPLLSADASRADYIGIAPGANLVDVRVLNSQGNGRISSVIRGIQWVVENRTRYNIRVLNLSLGGPASSSYRRDPLSAALEIAWKRGIVVVAAAGNGGPGQGAVETPAIDPYLITVGSTDDSSSVPTPDDLLASFSSWGVPADSVPKPDLVAPGRRIVSLRVPGSYLDRLYPDRVVSGKTGANYFRLTGTSMSSAVVSGVVAAMLERRPSLKPDQVKALLSTTTQAYGPGGLPVLPDPMADGSALVDAYGAFSSSVRSAANKGLRPADAFARALYPILYGQPLAWKDPNYAGIDWNNLAWDNLAWDNLAWDNLAWDNLAWDNLAWDNLAWDNLAWDNLAWDNLAWDNLAWDSQLLD